MRLDMRVDALVDEWHAGGVPDESEVWSVGDASIHGGVPFDGQAEPDLRLCAKGATVSTDIAGAGAVHRAECASECLGRPVPVPHGDAQQVAVPEDVRGGDGHASTADVLRQRHPGQRREHPPQVVFGRAEPGRHAGQIEFVGEMVLDQRDESVQFSDHGSPFDIHPSGASRSAPYYRGPIRSDPPRESRPQAGPSATGSVILPPLAIAVWAKRRSQTERLRDFPELAEPVDGLWGTPSERSRRIGPRRTP